MSEKIRFISLVTAKTIKWISVAAFAVTIILTFLNYSDYKKIHTAERYLGDRAFYENCSKEHPQNISWFCGSDPQAEYNKNFKDFFYGAKSFLIFSIAVFIISTLLIKLLTKMSFIKIKISNKTSYLSTLIINSANRVNILLLIISSFIIAKIYDSTQSCGFMTDCERVAKLNFIFIFIPYLIFSVITLILSVRFKFNGDYETQRTRYVKVFAFITFCISRTFLLVIIFNILSSSIGKYSNSEIIMGTFFLSIPIYYLVLCRNLIKNTEITNNNITTTPEIDKILENVANQNKQ